MAPRPTGKMFSLGRKRLFFTLLGVLVILVWSGCRESEPTTEGPSSEAIPPLTAIASADIIIVETGEPRLTQVQAIPAHVVLSSGETIGLSAIPFDQEGRELDQANISWQVVDPQAGSVTPRGVFRAGFTQGTFEDALVVTARIPSGTAQGLVQATASVTVAEFSGQLEPKSVKVFPAMAEVEPGESLHLVALALDANGVAISNMKFRWESLDPLAGKVSQDGRLTAGDALGDFPDAVRVSLIPSEGGEKPPISSSLSVRVLDPESVKGEVTVTVLPQVISLRPNERIRFTALVLDRKGGQVTPEGTQWEMTDPEAGIISPEGRFAAGSEPGVYSDAIRASIAVPGADDLLVATGTVIVVDVAPPLTPSPERMARVAIFPERITLSPGESTRVSIVGLNGDLQRVPEAEVRWSLSPPEVGQVSQFVTVTANDFPGVYEGAIQAQVTLETEDGLLKQAVSATLVIRGSLARAEVTPGRVRLAEGERMQFRALAYDENGVLLPDVFFRWSVADPAAGAMDSNGLFTAKGEIGEYLGAVQVEAMQRRRSSGP